MMPDDGQGWMSDPAKREACGRLERLGAAIGPINDSTLHVELLRRRDGTPIQDADITWIVADMNILADATTLDLSDSAITDLAAYGLGRLRSVTALYLSGTGLTDSGIPHLAAIPLLRELVLSGTRTTDAGVAALEAAAGLRFLQLQDTKVTEDGVARLTRARPGLSVER